MEYEKLMRARYSVRSFLDKPVEPETLRQILEAGQVAPTACNRQPQRILVVQSPDALEKMRQCTRCHFDAPVVLLVCYDADAAYTAHKTSGINFGQIDATIATTQMMLMTHNLGLGCCWVGLFDPDKLRTFFHVPVQCEIMGLLPLGYPAPDAAPAEMHTSRFPLEHTVFYDSF